MFTDTPPAVLVYELGEDELAAKRAASRACKQGSKAILAQREASAAEHLPTARRLQQQGRAAEALSHFREAVDVPGGVWGRPKLRHRIEALEAATAAAVAGTTAGTATQREEASVEAPMPPVAAAADDDGGGRTSTDDDGGGLAAAPAALVRWELGKEWEGALQRTALELGGGLVRLELSSASPAAILVACNGQTSVGRGGGGGGDEDAGEGGGGRRRGGVNERDPTGMQPWGLARTLSAFVVEQRERFRGRAVLELGCGQGMCGLVAAHFAQSVTLTDYEPSVLALAELNARAALESGSLAGGCPHGAALPEVQRLVWSRTAETRGAQLPGATTGAAGVAQMFDVMLGSELLYHETDIPALMATVDRHLARGGVVILTFHVRVWGLVADLKAAAAAARFRIQFVDVDSVTADAGARQARGEAGSYFAFLCREAEVGDSIEPWLADGRLRRVEVTDEHAGTQGEIEELDEAESMMAGLFDDTS